MAASTLEPNFARAISWPRALTICLSLALFTAAVVRFAVVLQPAHLDWLVDDSFISLSVAKSIGEGRGFRSSETPTSGFQPLYVLATAPIYAVLRPTTPDALDSAATIALCVGVLADLVGLAILGFLLFRASGPIAAGVGAWLWALHPGAIDFATNGLETSMWLASVLGAVAWFEYGPRSVRSDLFTGALCAVAALARVDALFLAVAIVLVVLWQSRKASATEPLGRIAWMAAGGLAVYGPWLAVLWWQTGDLVPCSGAGTWAIGKQLAVLHGPGYLRMMTGVALEAVEYRVAAVAGMSLLLLPFARVRALRVLLVMVAMLAPFYIWGHSIWFYVGRYLAPMLVVQVAVVALGCAAVWEWRRTLGVWAAGLAILACTLSVPSQVAKQSPDWTYRPRAIAASQHIPENMAVGAPESGAAAYYLHNRDVVNLDGVVDKLAYEAITTGTLREYLQARRINVVISAQQGANGVYNRAENVRLEQGPWLGGEQRPWWVWRLMY